MPDAEHVVQPAGDAVAAPAHEGRLRPGSLADDLAAAALGMARRFWAGATLWSVAPAWPEHARHVAVEFVHPVIVGTRALPAVAVTDPDPLPALRSSTRPGDLLLAVSDAGEESVARAMRRSPAWGLTTLWIGGGERPPAGAADHVLWLEDGPPAPARTGDLVMLYHLLWELTHVCFEHPGLLEDARADACATTPGCITCADEGRLGEVLGDVPGRAPDPAPDEGRRYAAGTAPDGATASVRTAAGVERVDTTLVGSLRSGDLVLVHAGAAIDVIERAPEP